MLYLDDIQHTNPELLQKFISLCDAQRTHRGRLEGPDAHLRPARQEVLRRDGGQPVHRDRARASRSRTCSPTAPTPTTSATSSAGKRGAVRARATSRTRSPRTPRSRRSPTREPADVHKLVRMAQGEDVPLDRARARLLGGRGRGDPRGAPAPVRACRRCCCKVNQRVHPRRRRRTTRTAPSRRSSCRAATAT